MLKINNLTKIYGTKKVVNDLTVNIDKGEICAFIGHNGAGKTTTLKAIAGIIDFNGGEIFVNGIDVAKNPIEAKKQIGFLPDNPELYDNLRGIEYLNFIADVFDISEKEREQRITEYATRLNILQDLNTQISTYSHGMKQKIALISVLLHKPKLYLFDEPFVGLDPVSSHELKEIMKEECKKGSSFFYSTHILESAEKISDTVVIIKKGKLVGSGTLKEVRGDKDLEDIFLDLEKDNG